MENDNLERFVLLNKLLTKFSHDLDASLLNLDKEEQITILDYLIDARDKALQGEDFPSIYKSYFDPILVSFKGRSKEFFQTKPYDYFFQGSLKFTDFEIEEKLRAGTSRLPLSDEEHTIFMFSAGNLLSSKRHYTYLSISNSEQAKQEEINLDSALQSLEKGIRNKEHTMRKKTLFIYYYNKRFPISQDKKPLAELIQFLTGDSYDNIYKRLRMPLQYKEEGTGEKGKDAMIKDLTFVCQLFEKNHAQEIVTIINKDINSLKKD